jgi:hypothetical protein
MVTQYFPLVWRQAVWFLMLWLSDFHLLNKDYDIIMDSDKTCKTQPVKVVNNVSSVQNSGQNKSDSSVFFDEFNISETLSLDQQEKLSDCLLQNRDIFVTKENPNLCYTTNATLLFPLV